MKKKQTRTLMEKLEGISFLESLGLTPDTIESIEDGIDNPENSGNTDDSNTDDNTIINEYIKYSMVINRTIIYHDKEYKALGITKDGHLLLDNNGIKKEVQCDEITFKEAIIK